MWHAIPVQAAAIAADRIEGGPSLGDFGIPEPGVETGQGDTLSADGNFLAGLLSPAASKRDGVGLAMMPRFPKAFAVASREPVTGAQQGRGEPLEESALLTNLQTEPGGTQPGTNGAAWAGTTAGLIPGVTTILISGLAPLMTNGALVPPAILTPLATVITGNREAPDAAKLEKRARDGPGSGDKTALEGFLLDAREWLPVEHPPRSIETPPAWTTSPIAHSPVSDQRSRPPAPTSTGHPSPPDGPGPMPSLNGVNVENTLPGTGVKPDPLSFVVRVAQERSHLGGGSPELPKMRDSETLVGSVPSSDGPSREKALGRTREGSFDRIGKDPGTVVQVRSMAALGSSVGGQAESGDPHHNPFAREESALPNAIPRAGGERDLSSWVPGHGADYVAGMAGQPTLNESGSGTGMTTAKLQETAEPMPELAPERLTAAPRELVLTIPGSSDGEGVLASIHVRDHNGAVEIAVRTPDAQLSSSLQDGLPELVARLESQGTTANGTRGDQMSEGATNGGPTDWSGMQDGQRQEGQPQKEQTGQGPGGGGRDERQQHPEDRGQPRGQPGNQIRELRQQRQARWQASLGLASR